MVTTTERPSFRDRMTMIDAERRPVDPTEVIAALVYDRVRWPKWSAAHRSMFRWDVEIALTIELRHATNDWHRAVKVLQVGSAFDDGETPHPAEYFWLPRERAAARALNALRHASIAHRAVSDQIRVIRRPESTDDQRRAADIKHLHQLRAAYRKLWRVFLDAMTFYREKANG